ncbi:MAG: 3-deoxy-D-manno-octulosonic acid kinase [Pseudomonadota bacterium]
MIPIEERSLRAGQQHILYDARALGEVPLTALPYLFEPAHIEQKGWLQHIARGRGDTWFYDWQDSGLQLVLRHYRRGGLVGRVNPDLYLNRGIERSRPWREWHLLCQLVEWGLPVPRPAAVRLIATPLFYRADMLTHRIVGAESLAERLTQSPLPEARWSDLGALVARFHRHGVYHDDLNAMNLLLTGDEDYLIDFDKGCLRDPARRGRGEQGQGWSGDNLARLRRSLDKLQVNAEAFFFSDGDWSALLSGYASATD